MREIGIPVVRSLRDVPDVRAVRVRERGGVAQETGKQGLHGEIDWLMASDLSE